MLAGYDKTRGMLVVFPVNPDSVAQPARWRRGPETRSSPSGSWRTAARSWAAPPVFGESPERRLAAEERREPALILASTLTAPAGSQRLGCLIAFWVLRAAPRRLARGRVRRSAFEAALMRCYRDVQGRHPAPGTRPPRARAVRDDPTSEPGLTGLFARRHAVLRSARKVGGQKRPAPETRTPPSQGTQSTVPPTRVAEDRRGQTRPPAAWAAGGCPGLAVGRAPLKAVRCHGAVALRCSPFKPPTA